MKKDITYRKFIKPQIVRKERQDKREHREKQYEKAMRVAGLEPQGIDAVDLGIIALTLAKIRGEKQA